MYKNQLQELAQRSCFNLPSYVCIREGPDHAPRFKATVNFNGEVFESPNFCTTLRQAEHAAAEVALNSLSCRGPSHSLAARILDETGVYKNLLQEVAQRVGAPLPSYTTVRSGLGHLPIFTCTVELAGITFTGGPAKNKKQAEKNAAMAAWSSLKQLAKEATSSSSDPENNDEQEQITIARALLNYRLKEKMAMANNHNATSFPVRFPVQLDRKPTSSQSLPPSVSKILPMVQIQSSQRTRPTSPALSERSIPSHCSQMENQVVRPQNFPVPGAAPYIPVRHYNVSCHRMAPPVSIRTAMPVFSALNLPQPTGQLQQLPPIMSHQPIRMASPVRVRPSIPVFAAPPPLPAVAPPGIAVVTKEQVPVAFTPLIAKEPSTASMPALNAVPVAGAQVNDTTPDVASSLIEKVSLLHKAPDVLVQSKGVLPSILEFELPVKDEARFSVQKVEPPKAASKQLLPDQEMNHHCTQ